MRGSIDLSQIRAVVLDEADEMLDLGFAEDLEMILDETPDNGAPCCFLQLSQGDRTPGQEIST